MGPTGLGAMSANSSILIRPVRPADGDVKEHDGVVRVGIPKVPSRLIFRPCLSFFLFFFSCEVKKRALCTYVLTTTLCTV